MMEQLRGILLAGLCVVGFLLWNAWHQDNPATLASNQTPTVTSQASEHASAPLPSPNIPEAMDTHPSQVSANRFIHVKTDVLDVTIDKLGGNIVGVKLPAYPKTQENPNEPITLLDSDPANFYIAQSGLVGAKGPDTVLQQAEYTSEANDYRLAVDQDQLVVNLNWVSPQGLKIVKSLTFSRDDYLVKVNYQINNQTSQPWSGYLYAQLQRKEPVVEHNFFQINPYLGAAISSPEKRYDKIAFDNMRKTSLNKDIKDGWAAFLQHYFVSAWIPNSDQTFHYSTQAIANDIFLIRLVGPMLTAQPGQQLSTQARFYAGPAIPERLEKIAPGLNLTVDYGILWPIATAIFWLMKHIYDVVKNWGWAIILVTLCIKVLFYRLSAASYKSMAAMRRLQPRLVSLKERYGDDRQKLSQATMELYRSEKINPLGGCLPILVQIPVFIALYWVLLESVELRHAPFVFWIKDLSAADPYYVLPILMGISLFFQQRLNPAPMDPMQAKIMMAMPILLTVLFLSFPAGLVLYWVVNNVLSILQQWYIMEKIERPNKPKNQLTKATKG